MSKAIVVSKGSASSGNHGHAGRPGQVGGSTPGLTADDPAGATVHGWTVDPDSPRTMYHLTRNGYRVIVTENGQGDFRVRTRNEWLGTFIPGQLQALTRESAFQQASASVLQAVTMPRLPDYESPRGFTADTANDRYVRQGNNAQFVIRAGLSSHKLVGEVRSRDGQTITHTYRGEDIADVMRSLEPHIEADNLGTTRAAAPAAAASAASRPARALTPTVNPSVDKAAHIESLKKAIVDSGAKLPETKEPPKLPTQDSVDYYAEKFNYGHWKGQTRNTQFTDELDAANEIMTRATGGKCDDAAAFIKAAWDDQVDPDSGYRTVVQNIRNVGNVALTVDGSVLDSNGHHVGTFVRTIKDNGEIHHDLFRLDNSSSRNTGFGSRWYENQEAAYKAAGMKQITITANLDVGGYAWARMGFDFANSREHTRFQDRLDTAWSRHGNSDDAPRCTHPWEFAAATDSRGQRVGKSVLLGSWWEAVKNLSDDDEGYWVGQAYYASKRSH